MDGETPAASTSNAIPPTEVPLPPGTTAAQRNVILYFSEADAAFRSGYDDLCRNLAVSFALLRRGGRPNVALVEAKMVAVADYFWDKVSA
jgi:hypothetical protein